MVDFSKLKAMSGKQSLDAITAELNKITKPQTETRGPDERFWSPTVDKAGNGYAVIRFLPAPEGEDLPWVRLFDHGFQGPTGLWYIENSLTTLNKNDPVSEYNSQLWNSGVEVNKEIARKQKRRLHFISNIYVITDQGNPENEGKVFLYKFGKKIFDKLNEAMDPQFADETPVNPFDLWAGANFKLKIRKVEGYRNYDKSEFDAPNPLFPDDSKLETVWKAEHSLKAFIDPSNFKSYEQLKERLVKVLDDSGDIKSNIRAEEQELPWGKDEEATPSFKSKPAPTFAATDEEDEDSSFEYFKKLAQNK